MTDGTSPTSRILEGTEGVTIRRIRREEQRGRLQRGSSAQRRAGLLKAAADVHGSKQAVADLLGNSVPAVSKAIARATVRPAREEPPITFIEVELPTAGDAVLTVEEWRQLPAEEQPAAAHVTESAWRARGRLLTGMLHVAEQGARAYGEVWFRYRGNLDRLSLMQMHEELREEVPDLPDHLLPVTTGELAAAVTVMSEAATSLRQQVIDCQVEQDRWRDRHAD